MHDDHWERRAVIAEINGRRVNESLQRRRNGDGGAVVVCECGRMGCSTTLELPSAEYEQVRTSFERFLIAPGHELTEIEEVVERRNGYVVVAKQGVGAQLAAQTDPRTEDG